MVGLSLFKLVTFLQISSIPTLLVYELTNVLDSNISQNSLIMFLYLHMNLPSNSDFIISVNLIRPFHDILLVFYSYHQFAFDKKVSATM